MRVAGGFINFNIVLLSERTQTGMVSLSVEGIFFDVDRVYPHSARRHVEHPEDI